MTEFLLHLPYVSYWLPIVAAVAVAVPLLWLLTPARAVERVSARPAAPVEAFTSRQASEQRRSFRRGGNSIGLLYKYAGQKDGPTPASILDRSIGGLCLVTHESFAVGSILSVKPTQADEMIPWVDVEVCTCRPHEDYFEIGCRFVKTPPYSIMLLFG